MAKIVLSDKAPEGQKLFSLASAEIEVPFETNDSEVLSNASAHPWLEVERDVDVDDFVEEGRPTFPADDASQSLANDPEAVAAEREAREVEFSAPTAIDAGLDQGDVEFVGDEDHEVAVTIAAHEEQEPVEVEAAPKQGAKPADEAPKPAPFKPTTTDQEKN